MQFIFESFVKRLRTLEKLKENFWKRKKIKTFWRNLPSDVPYQCWRGKRRSIQRQEQKKRRRNQHKLRKKLRASNPIRFVDQKNQLDFLFCTAGSLLSTSKNLKFQLTNLISFFCTVGSLFSTSTKKKFQKNFIHSSNFSNRNSNQIFNFIKIWFGLSFYSNIFYKLSVQKFLWVFKATKAYQLKILTKF